MVARAIPRRARGEGLASRKSNEALETLGPLEGALVAVQALAGKRFAKALITA